MIDIAQETSIEHLDFQTPWRRPQSDEAYIEQTLNGTDLDRRGMSRQALMAFAAAKGLTDRLVPGKSPTLVRDLMEHPGTFNDMVLIGVHHFSQAHGLASGAE